MADAKPDWQTSEAALVAEFLVRLKRGWVPARFPWTIYAETAGWDLVLVHRDGFQVGLEAKLSLNAKVIDQALVDQHCQWSRADGPDYRGVIVPGLGRQQHLGRICSAVGVGIVVLREEERGALHCLSLPTGHGTDSWPCWGPAVRCKLPDYIPDVLAGVKAPVQLTDWKVRAIKLMIVLERRGWVDRSDMRALGISPSRWTDHFHGFLRHAGNGQYERCERTPDFRTQHPQNFAQIEADAAQWGRELSPFKDAVPEFLLQQSAKVRA